MIMIIMMIKTKQQKNAKKINKMYLFILIYIYTRELLQIYIYIMYKEQKTSECSLISLLCKQRTH